MITFLWCYLLLGFVVSFLSSVPLSSGSAMSLLLSGVAGLIRELYKDRGIPSSNGDMFSSPGICSMCI